MNVENLGKHLLSNAAYLVGSAATVAALKSLVGKKVPNFWEFEEEFETLDEFLANNPLDEEARKQIAKQKVNRVLKVMGVTFLISVAGLIVGTLAMAAIDQKFEEDGYEEVPF